MRYLSGPEFQQRITDVGIKLNTQELCFHLSYSNRESLSSLGVNPPSLGKPLFPSPTAGTIQLISECLSKNFYLRANEYSEEDLKAFISEDFFQKLKFKEPFFNDRKRQLNYQWSKLPSEMKYFLIHDLVLLFLGPDEVIEDYGLVENAATFRQEICQQLESDKDIPNVEEALKKAILTLVLRDEFLSY